MKSVGQRELALNSTFFQQFMISPKKSTEVHLLVNLGFLSSCFFTAPFFCFIKMSTEYYVYALVYIVLPFTIGLARSFFTSASVRSRQSPCLSIPIFTQPICVRLRRATCNPTASHILRISRFLPSWSIISYARRVRPRRRGEKR